MKTTFIEASQGRNWGRFMLARFEPEEWARPSEIANIHGQLLDRGWRPNHLLVLDLATGEGAIFSPGGYAHADLEKHAVWVCPLFEPFLTWLWRQDVSDIDALPAVVTLTEDEAPFSFAGYRRPGPPESDRRLLDRIEGQVYPTPSGRIGSHAQPCLLFWCRRPSCVVGRTRG